MILWIFRLEKTFDYLKLKQSWHLPICGILLVLGSLLLIALPASADGENIAPTAHIDSITPSPAYDTQTVTFEGHGNDTDGTITAYFWESNLNGRLSNKSTFNHRSLAVGNHSITFRIRDDNNTWSANVTANLTVYHNDPPVVTNFNLSSLELYRGESLQLYFNGTDNESFERDLIPIVEYRAETVTPYGSTFFTTGRAYNIAISDDGRYIVVGCGTNDNQINLLERGNNTPIWTYTIDSKIMSIAISANGNYIVAGSQHYGVYLFTRNNNTPLWKNHTSGAGKVSISADGSYIVANSIDNDTVYLFERYNRTPIWSYNFKDNARGFISTDGNYIAVGSSWEDGKLYLFQRDNDTPLWSFSAGGAVVASISGDGKYIAASSRNDTTKEFTLYLFGRENNTPLWSYQTGAFFSSIAISEDGWYVIAGTGDDDSSVYVFNRTNGIPLWTYSFNSGIDRVAISNDGRFFSYSVRCPNNNFFFYERGETSPLWIHPMYTQYESFAMSTDGMYVAIGHYNKQVYLIRQWQFDYLYNLSYTVDRWKATFSSSQDVPLGEYTFRFRLMDPEEGISDWNYVDLPIIHMNNPPTAYIESITPSQAYQTQIVSFTGFGTDNDGSVTQGLWESSIDGILSYQFNIELRGLTSGNHTITFCVKDNDNTWSTPVWANLTINENNPPEVTDFNLTAVEVYRGQTIQLIDTVSDDFTSIEELNAVFQHESFSNFQLEWNDTSKQPIKWVGLSQYGNKVVASSMLNDIHVFDKDSGLILNTYNLNDYINSIAISSTADNVVASTNDSIYLYDNQNYLPSWIYNINHCQDYAEYDFSGVPYNYFPNLDISSNGECIAAGIQPFYIYLFNRTSDTPIWWNYLPFYEQPITDVVSSENGSNIAVFSNGQLLLYHNLNNTPIRRYLGGPGSGSIETHNVAMSLDGAYIVKALSTSNSYTLHYYASNNSEPLWSALDHVGNQLHSVAMSGDGRFIITADKKGTLFLFNNSAIFEPRSHQKRPLWTFNAPIPGGTIESIELSNNGNYIAAVWKVDDTSILYLFDRESNIPFWNFSFNGTSYKHSLALDETGNVMTLGTSTGKLYVFERWSSNYITNITFNSSHWEAIFAPALNATLGSYGFRSHYMDGQEGVSDWYYRYDAIRVLNNPPTAQISTINLGSVYNTQTIPLVGHGTDIDGDHKIVEYQWYSSLDGLLGSRAYLNITNLTVGEHTLNFRVRDSDGDWSENVTANLTVLFNQPPEAISIDASKLRLLRGQNLTLYLNGTDDKTTEEELQIILGYNMAPLNPPAWSYKAGGEVYAVDVSADGRYIGVGAWDHNFYLFATNSSEPIWRSFLGNIILDVAISTDGEYMAVGTGNNRFYFFEKSTNEPLWSHEFDEDIISVAISADGDFIAAVSGNYVHLFDSRSEALVWSYQTLGGVSAVDISNDGRYIVAASRDNSLYLFRNNKDTPVWNYIANTSFVSVAISADGNTIAAGTTGGELYTLDRKNKTPLWNFSTGDRIATVDISSDGRFLAAGSNADQVYLFRRESSIPLWNFSTGSNVNSVSISANGDFLGVGTNDGMIYYFNTSRGIPVWQSENSKRVFSVSLSADGEIMAAGTFDSFIHLFGINSNGISTPHYRDDLWLANFTLGYDLPVGNLTLRVRLIDQYDGNSPWLTANFTIEVLNNIPEAFIEYITPSSLAVINQPVHFNGSGFDLEGPIIGYRWLSDLDGLLSTNASFITTNLSAGNHTITFSVMDLDGDWSPGVNHSLRIDIPPTAFIDSVLPSPTTTGDEVILTGYGIDTDGNIAGFWWRSDIDGLLGEGPSAGNLTISTLSAGDHTIFFSVMDNDGIWSGEDNVSLHVNTRPVAIINKTNIPTIVQPDEEFTLSSDAFDPDGEIVSYRWLLEGVGYVGNGPYKSKHTMSIEEPGNYSFYFDVKDNEDAWSYPATWTLRVNAPPAAFIDDIFPQMVTKQANESFSISAHATDSDGEVVRYLWNFSGYDHETTTGLPMTLPTANLPTGNLTVFLSVLDNDGAWSSRVESWLYVNKPPKARVHSVKTQERPGFMDVTLKAQGIDNDGQIMLYQWRSDIDGTFSSISKPTFRLDNLTAGNHTFSLRVQDDFGTWSEWVEYEKPVMVTEGLDPTKFHVGGLAIPKWPLYILLLLIVVCVGYVGSRHININIVQKEVVEPRNRLLELRRQVEAAELEFPKEKLEATLDRLDFWHYRETKFEVTMIQLQMEKLLDRFTATRTLLTEVGELTEKVEEAKLEVDRERLKKAEKLFEARKLDEAHWIAISLKDELKTALGLDEEEDPEEEAEPEATTSFTVESSGVLRCGHCGAQNSLADKLIPATFKCKGCGTEGEVKV